MSLKGSADSNHILRGKINSLEALRGYSAYEVAVIHGFKGTEEEWLKSLEAPNSFTIDNPPSAGDVDTLSVNHPQFVDQMIQVAKSYYIKDAEYLKKNGRHLFNYHQYYTCFNDDFGFQETIPSVWPDRNKASEERRRYKNPLAHYNFLDCSAYINLVLRGIPYEKSPYTLLPEERANWGVSGRYSVGENNEEYPWAMNPFDWRSSPTDLIKFWESAEYTTKQYPSTVYSGEKVTVHTTDPDERYYYYDQRLAPRGAANLGKLLAGHGGRVDFNKDYSNVEPGDIILYSSGGTGYEGISHIAICVSKEPVMPTDTDYERFKAYPYKHRLLDSSTKTQYNTYGDEPDIPTFIQYIPVEDADGNIVDVISERYLETATSKITIVRPNLAYTYGNVQPIKEGGTGAATVDKARQNLGVPGNRNLLDNARWDRLDNIIDQQGGYVVPPGTVAYSDSTLTTTVGNPLSVYRVVVELTETYCRWAVSGVSYYAPASAAIRGYKRSGYLVDRWRSSNANDVCLIEDDGVRIINVRDSSAYFRQYFDRFLPAGTYTLSVLANEVTGEGAFIYCANTSGNAEWGSLTIRPGLVTRTVKVEEGKCNRVQITLGKGSSAAIAAIKLECGSVQTLAHQDEEGNWVLNDIPDKHFEMQKCKRHFERIRATGSDLTIGVGIAESSTKLYASVKIAPKQAMPSADKLTNCLSNLRYGSTTLKSTPTAVKIHSVDIDSGFCTLELTGTFTAGTAYCVGIAAGGHIEFDANL